MSLLMEALKKAEESRQQEAPAGRNNGSIAFDVQAKKADSNTSDSDRSPTEQHSGEKLFGKQVINKQAIDEELSGEVFADNQPPSKREKSSEIDEPHSHSDRKNYCTEAKVSDSVMNSERAGSSGTPAFDLDDILGQSDLYSDEFIDNEPVFYQWKAKQGVAKNSSISDVIGDLPEQSDDRESAYEKQRKESKKQELTRDPVGREPRLTLSMSDISSPVCAEGSAKNEAEAEGRVEDRAEKEPLQIEADNQNDTPKDGPASFVQETQAKKSKAAPDPVEQRTAGAVVDEHAMPSSPMAASQLLAVSKPVKRQSRYPLKSIFVALFLVSAVSGAGYFYYEQQLNSLGLVVTVDGSAVPQRRLAMPVGSIGPGAGEGIAASREPIPDSANTSVSASIERKQVGKQLHSVGDVSETVRRLAAPNIADAADAADATSELRAELPAIDKKTPQPRSANIAASRAEKIIVTKKPDTSNEELTLAYQAFRDGDSATSKAHYQNVLNVKPRNRHALLGLAALAVRGAHLDQAKSYYMRLMEIDATDHLALAGIANLIGQSDPIRAESELKVLLRRNPQAGYLNFSLGNIYVSQLRWVDARDAYFKALRSDSLNADYAFNLAISYERLSERKQALRYYRQALDSARTRDSGFSLDMVKRRVELLSTPEVASTALNKGAQGAPP